MIERGDQRQLLQQQRKERSGFTRDVGLPNMKSDLPAVRQSAQSPDSYRDRSQRPQGLTPSINSGLIGLVVMVVANPIAIK